MPTICHAGTWTPLSKPKITIPPCGIPHVQYFDSVGSKRFNIIYPRLTSAQLHQLKDFYQDNKTTDFDFKWLGDDQLSTGTFVSIFESFKYSAVTTEKNEWRCEIALLSYEEVIL